MMDLSFLEIATVINNIACSAIAALFLYMLRSKLIEHKLDTATWFVLLFLAYGLAYTTSSLRFIYRWDLPSLSITCSINLAVIACYLPYYAGIKSRSKVAYTY